MKYILFILTALIIVDVYGQVKDELPEKLLNEVLVTATKFKVSRNKLGQVIYLLTEDEIQQNAGKTVADLLNEVPGIQTNGNFSTLGQNIGIYMRGGRNKDTLILIDGMPINDPSEASASYDLRMLSSSQIERIEILKGGQSTLYGTGAAAGVINIILKKNVEKKLKVDVDINHGSFNTGKTSASIRQKVKNFSYSFFTDYHYSEGLSAASEERVKGNATPFDKDQFIKKSNILRLGYDISDRLKLEIATGYTDIQNDYDGGAFMDAKNSIESDLLKVDVIPTYIYTKGAIKLNATFVKNERKFNSNFPNNYKGENFQLDINQKHDFGAHFKGVWGVHYQALSYKQESGSSIRALYSQTQFSSFARYISFFYTKQRFNIHMGGRLNQHSTYGTAFVYNVNLNYLLLSSDKIKINGLGSISSSYITPTGFQLFSPDYGNNELTPERALSYEIGTTISLGERFIANVSYYQREETSPIIFTTKYGNGDGHRFLTGYEVDIKFQVHKKLHIKLQQSYVTSDDKKTFYNIPEWKGGGRINYLPFEDTSVVIKYNYTGERATQDFSSFPANIVDLSSFGLVDLYCQQRLFKKKLMIYGAINNILDTQFVDVLGYTTRGFNFNLGITYQL